MRYFLWMAVVGILLGGIRGAHAQTAEELTALIERLIQLDSIDLAKDVKFRPGLEPSLYAFDADESGMTVLKDPYEVQGRGKPGAAGWYRIHFVVPDRIGKIPMPRNGYTLGIESNVRGRWEIYTYLNGKTAGLWSKDGMYSFTDQPPTAWMSNAPMPAKPGDKITVAILASASPLGRGSPDGFALNHLRLRYALGHTAGRQPFYGSTVGNTGLLGARELLRTKQGDELKAIQERLRGPLSRLDAVFQAAETEKLGELTKAMSAAGKEITEALKK
jgi:hypothetical protein